MKNSTIHTYIRIYIYIYAHTHTYIIQPEKKKEEILPYATTWMYLEGSKLCKTSQTEKDRCYIVSLSLICETFLKKKEPQTHQREIKDWERGIRGRLSKSTNF